MTVGDLGQRVVSHNPQDMTVSDGATKKSQNGAVKKPCLQPFFEVAEPEPRSQATESAPAAPAMPSIALP